MQHEITGFEHLHRHSDFSLLDGYAMVEEYAKYSATANQKHLCISDHGSMAAVPQQIKWADNCKLNPVFACELYLNPRQPHCNEKGEMSKMVSSLPEDEKKKMRKSFHLLAIARTDQGYRNLVQLTSWAYLHGFYYRPRINYDQLLAHKEGLTICSGCYNCEIGQAFEHEGEEAAFAMVEQYKQMFGEHFYLEMMLLDFDKQKPYNAFLVKAHDKYNIPMVITNDCHYCLEEDSQQQRYMLMIQTNTTLREIQEKMAAAAVGEQTEFFELQDKNLFMKTEDELNVKWEQDYSSVIDYELFKECKRNAVAICESTRGVKIDRTNKLPHPFDDEDKKLWEEIEEGLKWRGLDRTTEVIERINEEYKLICRKEFSSYFLIEQMICREARRAWKEIMGWGSGWEAMGPGRGSGVGSLVNYLLGITDVNPLIHNLLFSRFMSPARGGKTIDFKFRQDPLPAEVA